MLTEVKGNHILEQKCRSIPIFILSSWHLSSVLTQDANYVKEFLGFEILLCILKTFVLLYIIRINGQPVLKDIIKSLSFKNGIIFSVDIVPQFLHCRAQIPIKKISNEEIIKTMNEGNIFFTHKIEEKKRKIWFFVCSFSYVRLFLV